MCSSRSYRRRGRLRAACRQDVLWCGDTVDPIGLGHQVPWGQTPPERGLLVRSVSPSTCGLAVGDLLTCASLGALCRFPAVPFAFGSERLARLAVQAFFIGLLRA